MTDPLEQAMLVGRLRPGDVGMVSFEIRYYGASDPIFMDPHDDSCDLLAVEVTDMGVGPLLPHCSSSSVSEPVEPRVIEGIGGEYVAGGTVSYLSDDPDLIGRVIAKIGRHEPARRRECDDCRTKSQALASGFNPMQDGGWSDFAEPCRNRECRWYEPDTRQDPGSHRSPRS